MLRVSNIYLNLMSLITHFFLQGRKAEGIEHLKRLSNLKEPDTPSDKACYYQGVVLLGRYHYMILQSTNFMALSEFSKFSGLDANSSRGSVSYSKVCTNTGVLHEVLGFLSKPLPITYLGLPIIGKMKTQCIGT